MINHNEIIYENFLGEINYNLMIFSVIIFSPYHTHTHGSMHITNDIFMTQPNVNRFIQTNSVVLHSFSHHVRFCYLMLRYASCWWRGRCIRWDCVALPCLALMIKIQDEMFMSLIHWHEMSMRIGMSTVAARVEWKWSFTSATPLVLCFVIHKHTYVDGQCLIIQSHSLWFM